MSVTCLAVVLLAREAGLASFDGERWRCPMPVVPLFETGDDLAVAASVLRQWHQHQPPTETRPLQRVMLGYSDSNKDVGYAAALWALHRAEHELATTAEELGLRLELFHGRVVRSRVVPDQPSRFIDALPQESVRGGRITEQGEVLAQKYANLGTATHHLHQWLQHIGDAVNQPVSKLDDKFVATMDGCRPII